MHTIIWCPIRFRLSQWPKAQNSWNAMQSRCHRSFLPWLFIWHKTLRKFCLHVTSYRNTRTLWKPSHQKRHITFNSWGSAWTRIRDFGIPYFRRCVWLRYGCTERGGPPDLWEVWQTTEKPRSTWASPMTNGQCFQPFSQQFQTCKDAPSSSAREEDAFGFSQRVYPLAWKMSRRRSVFCGYPDFWPWWNKTLSPQWISFCPRKARLRGFYLCMLTKCHI